MLCTIIDIRGDYAYVKYDDTGVVSEVAIALLPFGVDLGDRLKFENYEFSLVKYLSDTAKINCCLSKKRCHCEPVRTLAWQSPG